MSSNKKKSKLLEKNLYELFGIDKTATESDIKKAYRKKALQCHPDKNPDNPKANDQFLELSEALEILTDEKARELYDRTLKAKELAKERTKVLDSKRRKLKEDLERREKEAKESAEVARSQSYESTTSAADEELLRKEIERLKKEGSRTLQEEQELIRQQILKEQQEKLSFLHVSDESEKLKPKFKIKWISSVSIDYSKLKNIFEKYGKVNIIVIKRSALVEFEKEDEAVKAFDTESVKSEYQWKFQWITQPSSKDNSKSNGLPSMFSKTPKPPSVSSQSGPMSTDDFLDFEAKMLGMLSSAAKTQSTSGSDGT